MGSHSQSKFSAWERIGLRFHFVTPFFRAIGVTILTVLGRLNFSPRFFRRTFRTSFLRAMTGTPKMRMRDESPTTGQVVKAYCEDKKVPYESVQVESKGFKSATVFFIDTTASKSDDVLLYFHGGGYMFPLSTPNVLESMRKMASLSSRKLVVLEYTLAPESKYPSQLAQAVAATRVLLRTRKLSQLVIGGDSAGGNLTLGLLAHMIKPHPSLEALPIEDSDQLAGAFGISARTAIDASAPSYTFNADKDIISAASVREIGFHWQPDREHVWAVPVKGDKAFWEGLKAKKILLVVGADEVYLDDVREFAQIIGAEEGGATRQLTICADEVHDQWMLDMAMDIEDGHMTTALMKWAKTLST